MARFRDFDRANPAKTAAIGFYFGGKAMPDMARAGLDVLGVVSFHGVCDRPDYANVASIRAKVLVCHGWDDPLDPPESVLACEAAGVPFHQRLRAEPWGARTFIVRDPDGNLLAFAGN